MEAETPSCIAATESGPIGSAVAEPASEPDSIAALPDRAVLRRRLDALRDGADRLSILFSEQDGAAQIVVASADRDPRAAIRLRGQVSRLLGEFGLKLADFSFNGTRPANFPRGPIGGQYGDRTR
jgi:hypothetical protein